MRVEPLQLTFFPHGLLSKTTTPITTTTTITTTTNCNDILRENYFLRDDAENRKPPRRRTSFTDEQLYQLENAFQKCQYPKLDVRMKLALETQLPETRIQIWFKNRRAKYRKKLRNIADPEIPPDAFVPKFNAVITWRPNGAFVFMTSSREAMAIGNYSSL
uniref:Homeobox domain-containing protein n=1 Tax=Setaria digitata TaxID=48799 RepID=A0A915Q5V3_9BILA